VILRITSQSTAGVAFTNPINQVSVNLQSGYNLLVPGNPPVALSFPAGITGATNKIVMFTKAPAGGIEYIMVSGKWVNGTQTLPFFGASNGIRILDNTGLKYNPNFALPVKKQIEITSFNILGRVVFHTIAESYSLSIQVKDFQHFWKNKIASGAFIVRMSIKEGNSKPFTSLNKMMLR
jgi:hypothetical protein